MRRWPLDSSSWTVRPPVCALGLLDRRQFLKIFGQDDTSDGAFGLGDTESAIDRMPHVGPHGGHVNVLVGDVLEQRDEVSLLLVTAPERGPRLLADDSHYRGMVHLGVVEAIQQVNSSRTRRGGADTDLAGELGVSASHKGRHLLVPDLYKVDFVLGALKGTDDPVMPSPGYP